jgi:hypothetical protein
LALAPTSGVFAAVAGGGRPASLAASRHDAAGLDRTNWRPQVLVAAISVTVIQKLNSPRAVHAATWTLVNPAVDRRGCGRVRTGGRQVPARRVGSQRAMPVGRARTVLRYTTPVVFGQRS